MSAPFERRSPTVRRAGTNGFLRWRCAAPATSMTRSTAACRKRRRSPTGWSRAPRPSACRMRRSRTTTQLRPSPGAAALPSQDWRKIGVALEEAEAGLPDRQDAPIDRWLEAITETLALDPLEADILALALHYRLDQRVERLFDALSECRGGPSRFHRDAALIALLLNAPTAEVDDAADAGREAAGERPAAVLSAMAELEVLERLTSLIRRDMLAGSRFLRPVARHDDDRASALGCLRASRPRGGGGRRRPARGARRAGERRQHPALRAAGHRQDLVRRNPRGAGRRAAAPGRRSRRGRRRTQSPRAACRPAAGPAPRGIAATRCCCSTRRRTCSSAAARTLRRAACRTPACSSTACWSAWRCR